MDRAACLATYSRATAQHDARRARGPAAFMNDASGQDERSGMMLPLCPPEIAYPWTARSRRERARVFLLEGSQVPEHLFAEIGGSIPLRWRYREGTCEVKVGENVWECLHVSSSRADQSGRAHF